MTKGYADLGELDHTKGGIPQTEETKNRQAMLIVDKATGKVSTILPDVISLLIDFLEDKIDTIIIDNKR